jgi:hypothetical protein
MPQTDDRAAIPTHYHVYIPPELQVLFWPPKVFKSKFKLQSNAHRALYYLAISSAGLSPTPLPLPPSSPISATAVLMAICHSPNIQAAPDSFLHLLSLSRKLHASFFPLS